MEFYGNVSGWSVTSADGYSTLDATDFQLVIVEVPADIAATLTIGDPPARRVNSPIKLAIPVSSIADIRAAAPGRGAMVDPVDSEWYFGSTLVCDGHDPEGNVFQLRELPNGR
jgi:hypothetical protein